MSNQNSFFFYRDTEAPDYCSIWNSKGWADQIGDFGDSQESSATL